MRRVVVLALAFAAIAAFAETVPASAGAQDVSLSDHFTPAEIELARAYRGRVYALAFGRLGLSLLVLGLIGVGPGSRGLAAWTKRAFRRRTTRASFLVLVATVVPAAAVLPLAVGRHAHSRTYGLATNSAGDFLRDVAVSTGFELVIFGLVALLLIGLARRLPRAWPAVAAPAAAGMTVVLVLIFPVVVEPAFYDFQPVDAQTRERVVRIADAAGVEVGDVLVADASRRTTSLNAYVSGLGVTKRVVLFDTLLEQATPAELEGVVAHELAHQVHNDLLRGTAYAAGGVAGGVLVLWMFLGSSGFRRRLGAEEGPGDPAIIPFLALFIAVAMLVSTPVANAISRSIEARADRTALELTGDPEAMIGLQVRLAVENIADLDPHPAIRWALFSHPSTLERIRIAVQSREER